LIICCWQKEIFPEKILRWWVLLIFCSFPFALWLIPCIKIYDVSENVLLQVFTATTLCIGVLENHVHVFGDLLILNTLFSDFRFLTLNQIFVLFDKSVRVPSSVCLLGVSHKGETVNLFIDD